jgi:eukaryotic-like serine/threonine-protein kinase
MPPIPKTIGRYEILEMVGRGGMGVLYRARDPILERDVAVKMMHVDFSTDDTARERFQREARAVARLQHRNVVTIHELGEIDGMPYIVMEFLSGKDLDALLKEGRPMSLVQKLDIAIQLCDGLAYAHGQGIVHRDIKPGNVRVLEDATVKILDFGIAKFAMSSVTQSGTVMGTPSYMPPEQVMGQPVDGRADLFSAGVLLYELLSGTKPFTGESPTAVVYQIMHTEAKPIAEAVPDLPEALSEIVGRALQKNPNDRYGNATEMASDLQTVKMMVDLPLNPGEAADPSAATMLLQGPPTRPKTGSVTPGVLHARMRPSAAAAAADAAPRARVEAPQKSNMMWVGIGGVAVVAVLAGGYAMFSGGKAPAAGSGTAPAATTGAPAAEKTVVISSVPSGAAITVDGVDTGKVTPASVPVGRLPGKVDLDLKGYKPLSGEITDADLAAGSLEFKLAVEAQPARLTVSAPYAFELVQGSRVISASSTRHELTVQPGGAAVVARNRDLLLNATLSIDFQRGRSDITLPAPGVLAVFSAVETCTIVVDGQDIGFPPVPRKSIAAGSHTIELKCPDGKGDSKKVSVTAGERTQVNFGPPKG